MNKEFHDSTPAFCIPQRVNTDKQVKRMRQFRGARHEEEKRREAKYAVHSSFFILHSSFSRGPQQEQRTAMPAIRASGSEAKRRRRARVAAGRDEQREKTVEHQPATDNSRGRHPLP